MSTFRNLIRVSTAAMLAIGLAACGGGSSKPDPTAQEVCESADGRWNADGTCTSAEQLAVERQYMAVSNAIAAAKTAVDGLSAMSTDAQVSAAEGLVAAARTALGGANLLSGSQAVVLNGELSTVEGTLATTKTAIADHRQNVADEQQRMTEQRMAANNAIDAANTAVAGLSATSTDEEVQAAKGMIQAAKDAVAAATALSMADRDALNARITPIETMLAGTESDIADEQQRMGVSTAIDDAMAAVGALSETSSDDDVDAAKGLIAAAKTALAGATSLLTAEQALALNARISTIETSLATTETAIAARRQQDADDAETQRVADVATARMAAMQSYMDADADAMKAEAAAMAAEEAAPGSQGAMDARAAATAARTAANAAMAAHDAIMDDMSKADADAQAAEAATQAGNANSGYMTAKAENNAIQTAKAAADERERLAEEQQRMADQRMAANSAIDAANVAVASLSATSTDADVQAAKDAIQDAKDAVTAATALSMADRDAMNARITPIETMLAGTESDIADHRRMAAEEQQRMAVGTAIDDAMAAVGALTDTSSDDDVNAAKELIEAAETALAGATSLLTAEQALALNARISTIKTTLGTTETAIAAYRQQKDADDEAQRVADVAAARMAAMQSYMDADADAMKAETAAMAAEEAAPGSQGAMDAEAAAMAARAAANAAKAAHDAIMDDMSKADADAQAELAATEAGKANTSYMMAKAENDAIQTAKDTTDEANRVRDIADATEAADEAAMAARTAATAARTAATDARTAANEANAAYMRAVAARTDSDAAKTQADDANAAAMAAEMAAMAAEMAADAAEAAHMGIDADGSAGDAETAQMTAETKQGEAETGQGTADMQKMAAETARGEAMTAAGEHVLRLFMAANGAHVEDLETTMNVDETAVHVASVGTAMATIAAVADGAQAAGTTVTITFPGDTVDNPATEATDEFSEGMQTITVNVAGTTGIVAELRESRAATDLNNDGDTTDDGEAQIIQTAREIADLGVFQGYELWENDDDATTNTDRARAILFTNKQKGDDSVLAVTAATARSATAVVISTASELAKVTSTGTTITGVEWTPSGDTAPLTGTLTCPANTACDITLGDDGAVSAISGYTFTGSRAAVEAVTAADATEDNDYLAFGLWLEENDDGTTDTFGSFAVGGTGYAVNVQDAVTGTATYRGMAAGAHHKTGEGVNWFHGNALLTANFGAIDTDAERGTDPAEDTSPGTISGEISNIRVNGGDPMSESIVLRQAPLTDGTATFNGNARMGAGEIQDDDTVEYPYNGTWSGSFYGATDDDTDTADVDESVTAPLAAAGTFGVTMTEGTGDDAVTESFVGAFGAHKD